MRRVARRAIGCLYGVELRQHRQTFLQVERVVSAVRPSPVSLPPPSEPDLHLSCIRLSSGLNLGEFGHGHVAHLTLRFSST